MRKPIRGAIGALLLLTTLFTSTASGYLSDMAGHWAEAVVTALETRGLVDGDGTGNYLPEQPLTRAQMAKLLAIGLGYEEEAETLSQTPSRFADVSDRHWGRGYIELVAELGIAEGYPDGSFGPDAPISRAEMATFIIRAAGLSERARMSLTVSTTYRDDDQIPSWARGAVYVAQKEGLMQGMPDGNFYPDNSLTRAEGAAAIYRLLDRQGRLFHLKGTLVHFDPQNRTGTVRDAAGTERSFRMVRNATYLRQGAPVAASEIRRFDQAYVMLGEDGRGIFLEARNVDVLAESAWLMGDWVALLLPSGQEPLYRIQPGALILVNGQPAPLSALNGAGPVYAAFDDMTGEIRLVQALRGARDGFFLSFVDEGRTAVRVLVDDAEQRYPISANVVLLLEGERVGLDELFPGDEIIFALDANNTLTYMEILR